MNDFAAFLEAAGLRPGRIVDDGKWRRCRTVDKPKKKNGAYCLAPGSRIGWCQDWATQESPSTWRAEGESWAPLPAAPDYAEMRRRQEEDRAARQRATEGAREFYGSCPALVGGHEYLSAKGLDMAGCQGLKAAPDGRLVVPMWRDGRVVSLQQIAADGEKRFWPGAPTSATSYAIERRNATLSVLCEGLATGLALFAAVPMARVIVAFTAGNLPKVAKQLPRRGMACVAADNDAATASKIGRNPGIDAAREAAAILGCEVAIPMCVHGSDWHDLRIERVRALSQQRSYGRRAVSEMGARRIVDAEIQREIMRASRYLQVAG